MPRENFFLKWKSLHRNLEKAMATHSSTLAWKIPWTEEPGRLQSMGSWRVGHDWATSLSLFTFMHWRRKWQPTPVFLPGESQGRWSLVGCCLWGHTESDTTEATQQQQQQQHRNHSCLAQSFCWWGQVHRMWMNAYFWYCGRWVFCLLLGLHLCSDLTANWSLICVLYKKKNSAYIVHRMCIAWSFCALCAGNSCHVIPAPLGTCPVPHSIPVPVVCVSGMWKYSGMNWGISFPPFWSTGKSWNVGSLLFRLYQQNSELNWLCQRCLKAGSCCA